MQENRSDSQLRTNDSEAQEVPKWLREPCDSAAELPPVATKAETLPLHELTWQNTERLLLRLAERLGKAEFAQLYGVTGQEQGGIDLYVRSTVEPQSFATAERRYLTLQARRVARLTPKSISRAVTEFLNGPWADRSFAFIYATTHSLKPTQLAEEVLKQADRLEALGIRFIPWGSEAISDKLRSTPDIVMEFFGFEWASTFCLHLPKDNGTRGASATLQPYSEAAFLGSFQKATDHLSSGFTHARITGVHELLEIGDAHPVKRQTIVDTLCSYLRTPYDPADAGEDRVRGIAHRLLAARLRPERDTENRPRNESFWSDISVDLSDALLINADFSFCEFDRAIFETTTFKGDAQFFGATFKLDARFIGTVFDCWEANFERTTFRDFAWFRWTAFHAYTNFCEATFLKNAEFSRVQFSESADFSAMSVQQVAWFTHNVFHKTASFRNLQAHHANFMIVSFRGPVDFRGASFDAPPGCRSVYFEPNLPLGHHHYWPDSWEASRDDTGEAAE
ncbi:pentapeptide repeat-containing protein [Microbispora rosea]|uniref:pentapeptide repeat-containing protein n=1 Tax=Microbispora rosea TaxID=58117 RepID=UPI00368F14B3